MFVVTPSQMRRIDQRAIEEFNIPGIVLMENAALQTVQVILKYFPLEPKKITHALILAGCGNNGGDGLAIARHLFLRGYRTTVLIISEDGRKPRGDAEINLRALQALEVHQPNSRQENSALNLLNILQEEVAGDRNLNNLQNKAVQTQTTPLQIHWLKKDEDLAQSLPLLHESDLVIDALFGTGLDRPVTGLYAASIDAVNQSGKPVVSVDIPSGINGETGKVMGSAVRACHTVAYGYLKPGHLLFPGREFSGQVHVVPISLPTDSAQSVKTDMFTINDEVAAQMLKPRPRDGHKGTFGKVAVIAGSPGLTGAAHLTSLAAQRTGAGLVTLGIPDSLNPIMEQKLTEVMTFPLEDRGEGHLVTESLKDVTELLQDKDVLAFGPGCGKKSGVLEILRNILGRFNIPIVIDADGLNHISKDMNLLSAHTAPVVVTPHPGELSRMTGWKVEDIMNQPIEAAARLADQYGCIVLLKGAASVVASPEGRVYINASGNAGMAKGGSGDVLTGMIASMIAQGYPPFEAAVLGCYIHGRAGDQASAKLGETGMLAGDIIDAIPLVFMQLRGEA
ncbi:MAG TPA: NAD(P)H-hydrate dehydratase [Clostridiales bacterium]|jgi:NAD(P)H-hydrate epimerase|nr:NAD(P)H-hydrate dehydratase [Clostridiales bacterium]